MYPSVAKDLCKALTAAFIITGKRKLETTQMPITGNK